MLLLQWTYDTLAVHFHFTTLLSPVPFTYLSSFFIFFQASFKPYSITSGNSGSSLSTLNLACLYIPSLPLIPTSDLTYLRLTALGLSTLFYSSIFLITFFHSRLLVFSVFPAFFVAAIASCELVSTITFPLLPLAVSASATTFISPSHTVASFPIPSFTLIFPTCNIHLLSTLYSSFPLQSEWRTHLPSLTFSVLFSYFDLEAMAELFRLISRTTFLIQLPPQLIHSLPFSLTLLGFPIITMRTKMYLSSARYASF